MKSFDIPEFYKSPLITAVKKFRKATDARKKDLSPSVLDFGPVRFYLARHFGFCYGVENAIEISFKAVTENPGKRIFLISQMIHNPAVNQDLQELGVQFLQDTEGHQLISFDELNKEDIVIIPAFGTSLTILELLKNKRVEVKRYNTTCPFVERVWKKSELIGKDKFTIIIHGKYHHEETRATFSRSETHGKTIVIKDISEAKTLAAYIQGNKPTEEFYKDFKGKYSSGFNPEADLQRIGVINQTTMLASETTEIAEFLKLQMKLKFGEENHKEHFADTRDTLCYATNENQDATSELLHTDADLALVIGGYNSSNTTHLVELLEQKFPTYFISSSAEIKADKSIRHFNYKTQQEDTSAAFLPNDKRPVTIILTSGASCPDSTVEKVMMKVLGFFPASRHIEEVLTQFQV